MKEFLKDALEPLSYAIYTISVFLMLYKKKSVRKEVLLFYYFFAAIFISIACLTSDEHLNRMYYNCFFFITACVFSYYFKSLLTNKNQKKAINLFWLVHLIIFIKISLISHQLYEINNYVYAFTYLTVVVFALFYFENMLSNVNELNILHQFDFWLVSGYLLYFLSCFFIILFYDNVEIKQRAMLWSVQNIVLFISSLFTISGSLWINYQDNC